LLEDGDIVTITTRDNEGPQYICSTTFKGLPHDVEVGDHLLIDDGKIALQATEVTETDVVTNVVIGGEVSNNKGINLPGVAVSIPALTEKDEEDRGLALKMGVNRVARSHVRSASEMKT